MAIGPIGNTIYVNQQTPVVSNAVANIQNRLDFQNMVANAEAQKRDEKVQEIRPAEDNKELNPDREHERQEADQEQNEHKKREKKATEDNEYHHLDIKV